MATDTPISGNMGSNTGSNSQAITMTVRPDAKPFTWESLVSDQQEIVEQALALIASAQKKIAAITERKKKRPTHRGPFDLLRIDEERFHNVLLIDGARGSGKTATMLTLLRILQELGTASSHPSVQRLHTFYQDLHKQVLPLPILDLQPLPPEARLLSYIAGNFNRVLKSLTDPLKHPHSRFVKEEYNHANEAQEAWKSLMTTIVGGWDSHLKESKNNLDLPSYQFALERSEDHRLVLREKWHTFIDALSDMVRKSHYTDEHFLFIVPIDDADMNPHRCYELIECVSMLQHERIFFVLTGDSDLFIKKTHDTIEPKRNELLLDWRKDQPEQAKGHPFHDSLSLAKKIYSKAIPWVLHLPELSDIAKVTALKSVLQATVVPPTKQTSGSWELGSVKRSFFGAFEVYPSIADLLPNNLRALVDFVLFVVGYRKITKTSNPEEAIKTFIFDIARWLQNNTDRSIDQQLFTLLSSSQTDPFRNFRITFIHRPIHSITSSVIANKPIVSQSDLISISSSVHLNVIGAPVAYHIASTHSTISFTSFIIIYYHLRNLPLQIDTKSLTFATTIHNVTVTPRVGTVTSNNQKQTFTLPFYYTLPNSLPLTAHQHIAQLWNDHIENLSYPLPTEAQEAAEFKIIIDSFTKMTLDYLQNSQIAKFFTHSISYKNLSKQFLRQFVVWTSPEFALPAQISEQLLLALEIHLKTYADTNLNALNTSISDEKSSYLLESSDLFAPNNTAVADALGVHIDGIYRIPQWDIYDSYNSAENDTKHFLALLGSMWVSRLDQDFLVTAPVSLADYLRWLPIIEIFDAMDLEIRRTLISKLRPFAEQHNLEFQILREMNRAIKLSYPEPNENEPKWLVNIEKSIVKIYIPKYGISQAPSRHVYLTLSPTFYDIENKLPSMISGNGAYRSPMVILRIDENRKRQLDFIQQIAYAVVVDHILSFPRRYTYESAFKIDLSPHQYTRPLHNFIDICGNIYINTDRTQQKISLLQPPWVSIIDQRVQNNIHETPLNMIQHLSDNFTVGVESLVTTFLVSLYIRGVFSVYQKRAHITSPPFARYQIGTLRNIRGDKKLPPPTNMRAQSFYIWAAYLLPTFAAPEVSCSTDFCTELLSLFLGGAYVIPPTDAPKQFLDANDPEYIFTLQSIRILRFIISNRRYDRLTLSLITDRSEADPALHALHQIDQQTKGEHPWFTTDPRYRFNFNTFPKQNDIELIPFVDYIMELSAQALLQALAENPKLDQTTATKLLNHRIDKVLISLAENPRTPPDLLRQLSQQPFLMKHLAQNTALPTDILDGLACHSNPEVRKHVARNASTSDEAIRLLATDSHDDVRQAVAERFPPVNLTIRRQDGLAFSFNNADLTALLDTPTAISDRDIKAITYSNYPSNFIVHAIQNNVPNNIKYILSINPNITPDTARSLFAVSDHTIKVNLSKNPNTPTDLLDQLINIQDPTVPAAIATHPNTSQNALLKLYQMEIPQLMLDVLRHPNAPSQVFSLLLTELLPIIPRNEHFQALAQNPHCPQEHLEVLYNKHPYTHNALANNPNTPQPILQALFRKATTPRIDLPLLTALARNPSTIPMQIAPPKRAEIIFTYEKYCEIIKKLFIFDEDPSNISEWIEVDL